VLQRLLAIALRVPLRPLPIVAMKETAATEIRAPIQAVLDCRNATFIPGQTR
jgi:hypothetical protein